MIIARYGPCIGITLFRFLRWKLELWYAPADYSPPAHTHEDSSGEFFVLYGKGRTIWRKVLKYTAPDPLGEYCDSLLGVFQKRPATVKEKQEYNLTGRKYFKWFSVRAGTEHAFSKGETPMIWLCWETWRKGAKVTSVAHDFKLT